MGPPGRVDPKTHRTKSERFYHGSTSCSIMPEIDCDVVYCPKVRNKHWMFYSLLADLVNQFANFSFTVARNSVLTNVNCMCWAGDNGRVMSFLSN